MRNKGRSGMITHELMRELLKDDLRNIQEIAEFVPNEIVYKALIVREFMREHAIEDPRHGIREFHTFERERLRRLGFITGQDSASRLKKSSATA